MLHSHLSVLSRNPTVKGGEGLPSLVSSIHMDKQFIPVFTILKVRLRVKQRSKYHTSIYFNTPLASELERQAAYRPRIPT